jgi:Glycosyl hydrolase family 9/Cellulase N-terminal ig-like domain
MKIYKIFCLLFAALLPSYHAFTQNIKIVTNQVGYDMIGVKHAVIVAEHADSIRSFQLLDKDGKQVFSGKSVYAGPVDQWKNWIFYTIDFMQVTTKGTYTLQVSDGVKIITSYPFVIDKNVLEQYTLSDIIYYFKGQRSSGLIDKADAHISLEGKKDSTRVDAHGGWYDATGDYGIHLSHLSFSTYFNPQQVSLTSWALLKTYLLLNAKPGTDFRQYKRRVLDEAMFGVDFLIRMQVTNGSFYRSIAAPGPGKLAKDRAIGAENKKYIIKKSKDATFGGGDNEQDWKSYQCSYRSGGGVAIAALALASTFDTSGDYTNKQYLTAAENGFAFLEKHNAEMTNDGKENMLDDYCALMAATELYKATNKQVYQVAAEKRVKKLMSRLGDWKNYTDYWRVTDTDRPFFHAADAGLPLVSLLNYYPVANTATQQQIKNVTRRSMEHELSITHEVNNPFGYSRQLVQDTMGKRYSSFFFPHATETAPWWQGENARLGSIAAAARMAADLFTDDTPLHDSLESFATDQLNWILGLNPFDACMLEGRGHNNVEYGFFGTFEYTNAPGGIVNGITSGLDNEHDIDLNLSYAQTGKDYDWRWSEQWLPHATWYMLAVALHDDQ